MVEDCISVPQKRRSVIVRNIFGSMLPIRKCGVDSVLFKDNTICECVDIVV